MALWAQPTVGFCMPRSDLPHAATCPPPSGEVTSLPKAPAWSQGPRILPCPKAHRVQRQSNCDHSWTSPLLIPVPEPPLTSVAALACVCPLYSQPLSVLGGCCFDFCPRGKAGAGMARPRGWGLGLQSLTFAVSPVRGAVSPAPVPCAHTVMGRATSGWDIKSWEGSLLRLVPLCGSRGQNRLCLPGSPDRGLGLSQRVDCSAGSPAGLHPLLLSHLIATPTSGPASGGGSQGEAPGELLFLFFQMAWKWGQRLTLRHTRRGTWKRCYFYFLRQLGLLHLEPCDHSGWSRLFPLCWAFTGAQSVELHKQVPCKEAAGKRSLFSPGGPHLRRATYVAVAVGRGLGVGFHRLGRGLRASHLPCGLHSSRVRGCFLLLMFTRQRLHGHRCRCCACSGPGTWPRDLPAGKGLGWRFTAAGAIVTAEQPGTEQSEGRGHRQGVCVPGHACSQKYPVSG